MAKEIDIEPIKWHEPLRKVLAEDFKSLGGELPIRGGWGYTKEDAIIIDKNDPVVPDGLLFDGIGLEYVIVEKRIYEELIIFRKRDDRYGGIKWNLVEQKLINEGDRQYDLMKFKVTAFKESGFQLLIKDLDENSSKPDFDVEKHGALFDEQTICYERDYWFDITSFYGQ